MLTCGRCGKELMITPDCGMCESYRQVPIKMAAAQLAIDEGRFIRRGVHPFREDGSIRGIGFYDVVPASADP